MGVGSCGRFSQLPCPRTTARPFRCCFVPGTAHLGAGSGGGQKRSVRTAEYEALWKMTVERIPPGAVTYAHRLFAHTVRHMTGIPSSVNPGMHGSTNWELGCQPQQRCRHSSRGSGIARDSMEQIARDPLNPMPYRNRHGGYSAWADWWTGVTLEMQGIGEQRPAYVLVWRNALQTLKPGHFLRTLSRTGLAGRLQPVLCFATDVIRGRCSQRLSITNNIDSIFDNDQL